MKEEAEQMIEYYLGIVHHFENIEMLAFFYDNIAKSESTLENKMKALDFLKKHKSSDSHD
ncbi:MAG: hypothetical protein ACFFAS_02920 [Promethearchaeota archaeon]